MNNRTCSPRMSLRLSAWLLLVGQLLYIVVTQFHVGGDSNNHPAVFAEYAGSEDGLGHLLLQSIPQLETARAWATVVVLAALALACFSLLALAERRLAPWAHRRKDPAG